MKNKRELAIEKWVKERRPDLIQYLPMVESQEAMSLLVSIGFEAGRQFQHDNPKIPLNEPWQY